MSTKIVVLDDCDLSEVHLNRLRDLGEIKIFSGTPNSDDEIEARLQGAQVAILGWTSIRGNLLGRMPDLKMISVWATGYDYVDYRAAGSHGITVTNVPAYAGEAVSELTVGLMLAVNRHVVSADKDVRSGNYSWSGFLGRQLAGQTLGLIGLGDIGRSVANLARAFGMRVLAHVSHPSAERAREIGVTFVDLDALLSSSDVVSLHVPLTDETRHMIGAKELAVMKPTAYLINTARSAVVDQQALVEALQSKTIAGAALDDFDPNDEALLSLANVVLTPHIGFFTDGALARKGDICIANIQAYLNGVPQNVVNADYIEHR